MAMTSLVVVVAPRTGKIIKNSFSVFERGKIYYKMVYKHFVFKIKSIVRNRVGNLEFEFKQTKNRLF